MSDSEWKAISCLAGEVSDWHFVDLEALSVRKDSCALMRTYLIDVAQGGQLDLIDEIAHEDMVDEANAAFGGPPGRAGLRQHVVGFRRNVSNLTIDIQRIVGADDEVMAWWTFRGVHSGPWLGRPATGTSISGTVFSFFALRAGLVSYYRLWLCAEFPEPVVFDSSRAVARLSR
ncbi:MAG: ester cyclase [Pseudomonadota bacterium]